jgi:hypothetical protein
MIVTIRDFLAAAREKNPPCLRDLARTLDALASAYHETEDGEPADFDAEPPKFDYPATRMEAAARFPSLGLYSAMALEPGEMLTGDAVDDLADIIRDMREVTWRWEHLGESDARWMFRLGYSHWGQHLFDLRSYLHAQACEGGLNLS